MIHSALAETANAFDLHEIYVTPVQGGSFHFEFVHIHSDAHHRFSSPQLGSDPVSVPASRGPCPLAKERPLAEKPCSLVGEGYTPGGVSGETSSILALDLCILWLDTGDVSVLLLPCDANLFLVICLSILISTSGQSISSLHGLPAPASGEVCGSKQQATSSLHLPSGTLFRADKTERLVKIACLLLGSSCDADYY